MSDYNFLMEIRLSPAQLRVVNHLSRVSAGMGLNLYLTGGAVRDLTCGQPYIRNLNFTVEGNVQKLLRALTADDGKKKKREKGSGPSFNELSPKLEISHFNSRRQVASLIYAHGVEADLAMAHREVRPRPGRDAEIAPAGIFEDLRRRDFSADAMAISLHPNSRGLLLDPTNGAADIERREFRILNSRGFLDAPECVYRVLRLSRRLGFKLEERTQQWLEAAIESGAWKSLNPESQGRELRAALQEEHPARVLRQFAQRGLLQGLNSSLTSARIFYDRLEKIRSVARTTPGADPFVVYFQTLVEPLPPAHRKQLAKTVLVYPPIQRLATGMDGAARKLAKALAGSKGAIPSFTYRLLEGQPLPLLIYILVRHPKATIQNRIKSFLVRAPQVRDRLPRAELHALGIEPGPRAEAILNKLFMDMLDGKIKTQPQITKAMHELAGISSEHSSKHTPHQLSKQATAKPHKSAK